MPKSNKKKNIPIKKKEKKTRKETGIIPRRTFGFWTDFDRIFEDFRTGFENLLLPIRTSEESLFPLSNLDIRIPVTDIEDRGKDFLLKTELPGFDRKDDINIVVSDDFIKIEGKVGWEYDNETQKFICKERECRSFYREETLPEEIDIEKVQAQLENGILEVVLPKKTPKKTKKVKIE